MSNLYPSVFGPSSTERSRSAAERYAQVSAAYEGRVRRRPALSTRPFTLAVRRLRVSSPFGR